MALPWLVAFLAGAIAAMFAAKVWGQWSVRRRPHQLAWAAGLTLYALAAFLDAYVASSGWSVPIYRLFFAAASANVGLLGLGTILLATSGGWARALSVLVLAAIAIASVGQFAVPIDTAKLVGGTELGASLIPFSTPARWAFLLLNIVGGLALIGGALLSWWRSRQAGVLLIGVGALLPFLGGSLSTLFHVELRVLLQFLGIAVMFVGYLQGREALPPSAARAPSEG